MTAVQQYTHLLLSGRDVGPVSEAPAPAPVTSCSQPLPLGTSHVDAVLQKAAGPRTVTVHSCGGKKLSLPLGPSTTVVELKAELQRQTGFAAKSIDLVFGSQSLENGFDLRCLNASANLVLVHKVHGG